MQLQTSIEQLYALQARMSAYNHAMSVIYYDGATVAPKGTAANRGQTLSILSEDMYKLSTGKETVELLEYLDMHKDELDKNQARMVFLLLNHILTTFAVNAHAFTEQLHFSLYYIGKRIKRYLALSLLFLILYPAFYLSNFCSCRHILFRSH